MKRQYWIIIAIAGLCICAWVFFRTCSSSPSHKQDAKEIKAIQKEQNAKAVIVDNKTDSLQQRIANLVAENELLKKSTIVNTTRYGRLEDKISNIIKDHNRAIIKHDTAQYIQSCDSLIAEAKNMTAVVKDMQNNTESLVINYEKQIAAKDTIIETIGKNRTELLAAFNDVSNKGQSIAVDYAKLQKKNKRERFLSRGLAAAVLVLGIKMILSK